MTGMTTREFVEAIRKTIASQFPDKSKAAGIALAQNKLAESRFAICRECDEFDRPNSSERGKCGQYPRTPCEFRAYCKKPFSVCLRATNENNPWRGITEQLL